jgi:Flp pilus assembly protein protease CpaA
MDNNIVRTYNILQMIQVPIIILLIISIVFIIISCVKKKYLQAYIGIVVTATVVIVGIIPMFIICGVYK